MDIFEALLSTEVLAGVLIIGAFAMSIRSILHFTKEASELRPKLSEIERRLKKIHDGMSERKKAVADLTKVVTPIREKEGRWRAYFESLKELELEEEKRQMEQSEEAEKERRKRIQRKKMGFDGTN